LRRCQRHRQGVPACLTPLTSYPLLSFTSSAERPDDQVRRILGWSAKHYMRPNGILVLPRAGTRTQQNDPHGDHLHISQESALCTVPNCNELTAPAGWVLRMIDWAALGETYGRSCGVRAAIGVPCFRKHAMEWEWRVSPITITRPFKALKIGGPGNSPGRYQTRRVGTAASLLDGMCRSTSVPIRSLGRLVAILIKRGAERR
jgi:hypothetical protein